MFKIADLMACDIEPTDHCVNLPAMNEADSFHHTGNVRE